MNNILVKMDEIFAIIDENGLLEEVMKRTNKPTLPSVDEFNHILDSHIKVLNGYVVYQYGVISFIPKVVEKTGYIVAFEKDTNVLLYSGPDDWDDESVIKYPIAKEYA